VTTEKAAQSYLARGWSVIPLRPGQKRPALAWTVFEDRRATSEEVSAWWRRWPRAGVGIVCGSVSGLVVLDFDPRNGEGLAELAPRLPPTLTVETGGGGRHCYFRLPPAPSVPKVPALLPGLDVQGEGSYVVAPPSLHPNGRPYRWLPGLGLNDVPPASLPPVVRHLLSLHRLPQGTRRPGPGHRAGGLGDSVEGVLSRLDGVHRTASGWLARCPAHHDREPSLSVGLGDGGRVLLHCFAGCPYRDIARALDAAPAARVAGS
jgi:hypothetical protein